VPKIPNIFKGMERFKYATTINLNMGYYLMPLSENSKKYVSFAYLGAFINTMCCCKESSQRPIYSSKKNWRAFFYLSTTDLFMDDMIIRIC
jgi:hypothetical protein